jgi:hypothetical protein
VPQPRSQPHSPASQTASSTSSSWSPNRHAKGPQSGRISKLSVTVTVQAGAKVQNSVHCRVTKKCLVFEPCSLCTTAVQPVWLPMQPPRVCMSLCCCLLMHTFHTARVISAFSAGGIPLTLDTGLHHGALDLQGSSHKVRVTVSSWAGDRAACGHATRVADCGMCAARLLQCYGVRPAANIAAYAHKTH